MDPVTALGIAAAVAQFVGFGIQIVKPAASLYFSPSKTAASIVEKMQVASDLEEIVHHMQEVFKSGNAAASRSPVEIQLLALARQCDEAAKELQAALHLLNIKGPKQFIFPQGSRSEGETIGSALSRVWKAKKVDKLCDKLDKIRTNMLHATTICLWLVFT